MGRPKHLLEVAGEPMLGRVVRALRVPRVAWVCAVLRPGDRAGAALAESLGVRVAWAEDPDEGRAASVRAGVRASPPQADGLLVALADQPFLEPGDFGALIDAFEASSSGLVRASYDGAPGTPALFAASYRDELLALRGGEGGRAVLGRHASRVRTVPLDPGRGRDLDRPEDLQRPR